jgi:hypothetical protein
LATRWNGEEPGAELLYLLCIALQKQIQHAIDFNRKSTTSASSECGVSTEANHGETTVQRPLKLGRKSGIYIGREYSAIPRLISGR